MAQPTANGLHLVSITGADDNVSLETLHALGQRFPFVEWALLYVPKPGGPRNPTRRWREEFFASPAASTASTAVHLCFKEAFEQLLDGSLSPEVFKADRIQLNINARRVEFTDDEVLDVYKRSLDLGPDIILQHQGLTAPVVGRFLASLKPADLARVHVLIDESRGKGVAPAVWGVPPEVARPTTYVGFAGGINPENTTHVLGQLASQLRPYWIDMETGVRTDNEFDAAKVEAVLTATVPFIA